MRLIKLIFSALAILLMACSDESPTEPDNNQPSGSVGTGYLKEVYASDDGLKLDDPGDLEGLIIDEPNFPSAGLLTFHINLWEVPDNWSVRVVGGPKGIKEYGPADPDTTVEFRKATGYSISDADFWTDGFYKTIYFTIRVSGTTVESQWSDHYLLTSYGPWHDGPVLPFIRITPRLGEEYVLRLSPKLLPEDRSFRAVSQDSFKLLINPYQNKSTEFIPWSKSGIVSRSVREIYQQGEDWYIRVMPW